MKVNQYERDDAITQLRKLLKPGDTVYTVLRHLSRTGMSRRIDVYTIRNNRPVFLTGYTAKALDYRCHRRGGLIVSGCGMDMGFHIVYSLGRVLYPQGFKLTLGQYGRNGDTSGFDSDGGYALRHEWL